MCNLLGAVGVQSTDIAFQDQEAERMALAVKLNELANLPASERAKAIERLANEAKGPVNGLAVAALARIRTFESRYEMTSEQLVERLRGGQMQETAEIAEWLFLLDLPGVR